MSKSIAPEPIRWDCHGCGFAISDHKGTVSIPEPWPGQTEPLNWRPYHDACLPDPNRYGIPVEDLRTPAGLIRWTAHLYSKRWAHETNWHHVISAAVPRKGSGAIV